MILKYIIIFFTLLIYQISIFSMGSKTTKDKKDPMTNLNYDKVFNFGKIYIKYISFLEQTDCLQNVLPEEAEHLKSLRQKSQNIEASQKDKESEDIVINIAEDIPDQENLALIKKQKASLKKACLSQLYSHRRYAFLVPAKEGIVLILLFGVAAAVVIVIFGVDSYGSNLSVVTSITSSMWFLKNVIQAVLDLASNSAEELDNLEIKFAKKQYLIPRAIWPKINNNFMVARTNLFKQEESINFIDFCLGLTLYKQKIPTVIYDSPEYQAKTKLLWAAIDKFFSSYTETKENFYSIVEEIKILIGNFLENVITQKNSKKIKPLYLYRNKGGIGKTYFIENIVVKKIRSIFGNIIYFENTNITSAEELEGSEDKPGVLLRLLRNFCLSPLNNSTGIILLLDEADWISSDQYSGAIKRVFDTKNNSSQYCLSTYLGKGTDGSGIQLKLPPLLICIISNTKIENHSLANHFIDIKFPLPSKEALKKYALKFLKKNKSVTQELPPDYTKQLDTVMNTISNFRDIEKKLAPFVTFWYHKLDK